VAQVHDNYHEPKEKETRLLAHAADFHVVASCNSGRATVEVARRIQPDLVLLDFRFGDLSGDDVCRQLAMAAPVSRIIMLTAFDDVENLRRCLEAGAAGVLLKGTLDLDLVTALREVRDGRMVATFTSPTTWKPRRPCSTAPAPSIRSCGRGRSTFSSRWPHARPPRRSLSSFT
jgi:DNA-binding NarL/FixJ family response regulator